MMSRRKSPDAPVTATEASTVTRCARQYYLEHVAGAPIDAPAQRRRRAGTERHIAYTRNHFGVGAPQPRFTLRAVGTLFVLLIGLLLGWFALRAVGLLP
ncbi:MAG: hypothetical protein ACR2M1_05995 [Gemmatimonadaceae bacterium]